MSVSITHGSISVARVEKEETSDKSARICSFIGIFLGLALTILVFCIFPKNRVEQVNAIAQAAAEKAGKDFTPYTDLGLRAVVFTAVLLGTRWMTEVTPLATTALLPLVIFPTLQVAKFRGVVAPYAPDTIFLFMGGFMLALAMQKRNPHRRVVLGVVLLVGTKPRQLILGPMIVIGFLSMWVSNTATTTIILPISMSVLTLVAGLARGMDKVERFATVLVLDVAYSASTGSVAMIIGISSNALLVAYLAESYDTNIGSSQWILVGASLASIFLLFVQQPMVFVMFKPGVSNIPGRRGLTLQQWRELERMS